MDLTVPDVRAVLDLKTRPSLITAGDAEQIDEVLELQGSGALCNAVKGKKVGKEKVQGRLKEVPAL